MTKAIVSFLKNVRGSLSLLEHDIGKCCDVRILSRRIAFLRLSGDDIVDRQRSSADPLHLVGCHKAKKWAANIGPRAWTEGVPRISQHFQCVTLVCPHDFTPSHLPNQPGHAQQIRVALRDGAMDNRMQLLANADILPRSSEIR